MKTPETFHAYPVLLNWITWRRGLISFAANSGKIYLLITGIPNSLLTDSIQNRMWLPEIQKIILSKHPNQRDMIFGGRTLDPLRVVVYE
jgi:hypothetical protein